jgi:hypothetical protein
MKCLRGIGSGLATLVLSGALIVPGGCGDNSQPIQEKTAHQTQRERRIQEFSSLEEATTEFRNYALRLAQKF